MKKLKLLTSEKENEWDHYVESHINGTVYHKVAWRDTICKEFKHKPIYYYLESDTKIVGILPAFIIKSIFSKKIISIPYCPYGGTLVNNQEDESLLLDEIKKEAVRLDASYLELKGKIFSNYDGVISKSIHLGFKLDINRNADIIRGSLSKGTKRHLNKGNKNNYSITFDANVHVFYRLYVKHMKILGTPAMRRVFFENLIERHNGMALVGTIWHENVPAASVLLLLSNNTVLYDRGATNYDLRHLSLNYVLFWEIIKKFSTEGYKVLDFGRSVRESGTYQFKNGWRPEVIELSSYYLMFKGKIPDFSQTSWKRKLFTKIFKKIPRISVIDYFLRKNIP